MVRRCDVAVVGAGPAGSIAALCLARAGAHVALIDKRAFPRDKACGDLVGPRGVRLLADLGIAVPGARRVGDMIVVGPNGWRARLPAVPGVDYPGYALAAGRRTFDATLVEAAVDAGAHPVCDRVTGLLGDRRTPDGVRLRAGELRADVVVGADGATSLIASEAGLLDQHRTLWGFALRSYVDVPVEFPYIVLWEPHPWRTFPGYGWVFPTADGAANVGLGLAVAADRAASRRASAQFTDFLHYLARRELLPRPTSASVLGGWLRMGAAGVIAARSNVLLVGDAAALVNPLQGEGIAQAMASGRACAEAIIKYGPADAADHYRATLHTMTAHQRENTPVQIGMINHPSVVSASARLLTAPLVRTAAAGAWALYWNDLVAGAHPTSHRRVAAGLTRLVRRLTSVAH